MCNARAVMHAGIANQRFPLKLVAGKTFPALQAHAQPAILRIWQEAHGAIASVPFAATPEDIGEMHNYNSAAKHLKP